MGKDMAIEQLMLPKECRDTVLSLAHSIPLAGHWATQRILQQSIGQLYTEMLQSTAGHVDHARRGCATVPLISLLIIDTPFKRVATDIVGPLPCSRSGKRYILVLYDYATHYPEAVALRSLDAEHIAEEWTDSWNILIKFWDKMLPYLLFAYWEVPQASTGFSPFELLCGKAVNGPLDVLKNTWGGPGEDSVVSHQDTVKQELDQMLHQGIIKPVSSTWSANYRASV